MPQTHAMEANIAAPRDIDMDKFPKAIAIVIRSIVLVPLSAASTNERKFAVNK